MIEESLKNIQNRLEGIQAGTYLHKRTNTIHVNDSFSSTSSTCLVAGKGFIDEYLIFPGISISYQSFIGNEIDFHHDALHSSLEINHCHKGRIGIHMKNNQKVFLGEGDMALQPMDCCADADITLPLGFYEGIMITINLIELEKNPPSFLANEFATGKFHLDRFCNKSNPVALTANHRIEHIFCELYQTPEEYKIPYMKLKVLELILFLCQLKPDDENILNPYLSEQLEVIKSIHLKLTNNLNQRFTIEELSSEYLMNATTLKNTFKSMYGLPIASYMKQYRIQAASNMLRENNASIAEVAASVGYESQGKFTKAFKELIGMSPTEFRKQYEIT